MFKTHNYAFQISTTMKAMFLSHDFSHKFGLGIIAAPDFIEGNPFIPITMVLGHFYNKIGDSSKTKIDDFMESYSWLMGKSIEEIGEKKITKIITHFNDIVATV